MLEHLIRRVLEETLTKLMATSLTQLNATIAQAATAADALTAAAATAGSGSTDFTPQNTAVAAVTSQIQAVTAQLGGTGTTTPPGTITASPPSLNLTATASTQLVSLTGATAPVAAISSAPSIVTVTPASGNGPFTVNLVPGATGTASVTFTDAAGNTVTVPVTTGAGGGTGPGTGGTQTVIAIPATVALSAAVPTVNLAATQSNASAGIYTGVIANPNIASITPASGSTGIFTLTRLQPGTTSLLITDQAGLNVTVPVTVT
jgi:uncharacterized cupredoxin-like copper-binding protein